MRLSLGAFEGLAETGNNVDGVEVVLRGFADGPETGRSG